MAIKADFQFDARGMADYRRFIIGRTEAAALYASDRLAETAKQRIRATMAASQLGRLGQAIGSGSDLDSGNGVYRRPNGEFSASGSLFIRSQSERTRGAIIAYTEGAEIAPKTSAWLWIPSPELYQRVRLPKPGLAGGKTGGFRITPQLYNRRYRQTIGPLVFIPGKHAGEAFLIVRDVSVRTADGRAPRRIPNSGTIRRGRTRVDQFIAFTGIQRTSRKARVFVRAIIQQTVNDEFDRRVEEGLRRG